MASLNIAVEDKVAVCEFNRPQAMNSIDPEMRQELYAFYRRINEDEGIHAVVFTGAGDKAFCTGADLKKTLPDPNQSYARQLLVERDTGSAFMGLETDKPLICAVNGYALAGGTEISLACDMIVARRDAQFGIPEVKRSLVAAARGVIYLPRLLPRQLAMELALTGDPIGAERLAELGVVNRITDGPAIEAARELAATIAANGPLALMATKALMRDSWNWEYDELEKRQNPYIKDVFSSEDAREGASAFAEKRKPVWKGK